MIFQILEIWNHVVDARHRFVRVANTAVNHEDVAIDLDDGAVFAIFVETAQGENSNFVAH
jgi:hypothetical protein